VALGGALLVFLLPWARRIVLLVGLLGLAGIIGYGVTQPAPALQIIGKRLQTISTPESNPYDNRPAIYREAFREISVKPWTGEGPGNFPVASGRSTEAHGFVSAAHAHDVLLTVAAEEGIPAAIVLVIFTVSVGSRIRRVARWPDRGQQAVLAGVAAALLSIVGHGLVDYAMINVVVFLVDWFLVGAGLVLVREVDLKFARHEKRHPAVPVVSGAT
jgi:O-antigen ligase